MGNRLRKEFSDNEIEMRNAKNMFLVINEIQIKTSLKGHLTPVRITKIN